MLLYRAKVSSLLKTAPLEISHVFSSDYISLTSLCFDWQYTLNKACYLAFCVSCPNIISTLHLNIIPIRHSGLNFLWNASFGVSPHSSLHQMLISFISSTALTSLTELAFISMESNIAFLFVLPATATCFPNMLSLKLANIVRSSLIFKTSS